MSWTWVGRPGRSIAVAAAVALMSSGCAYVSRVSESSAPTAPTIFAPTASGASDNPSLNVDGRYVAFDSNAPNLLGGDSNGVSDVFVRDRTSGAMETASVSTAGALGNGASTLPRLSPNARYVVFVSSATNLVPGDTNGQPDVFLRDRTAKETSRVSMATGGGQAVGGASGAPAVSADGRYVAFSSDATNLVPGDTNGKTDVFVRDRVAGTTTRVSVGPAGVQANSNSKEPTISADGSLVAFASTATNLVVGDTNNASDVFVRNRPAGLTIRASVSVTGAQGALASFRAEISGNGRYVVFNSDATNLTSHDLNGFTDVFVRDLQANTTVLASFRTDFETGDNEQLTGRSLDPTISADGRYVAFWTNAANVFAPVTGRVFRRDLKGPELLFLEPPIRNGPGDGNQSGNSTISADGTVIGYSTRSTDVAWPDPNGQSLDVYVRDVPAGTTDLVSRARTVQASAGSNHADVSADGRYVVFASGASDLVPGDTNGVEDIFLRDLVTGSTRLISVAGNGDRADGPSRAPAISADGRYIVYESDATNIWRTWDEAHNDFWPDNGHTDIFMYDRVNEGTGPPLSMTPEYPVLGNGDSHRPDISPDGREVTFESFATNLSADAPPAGVSNVYWRGGPENTTVRMSVGAGGGEPNGASVDSSMSADGRFVSFSSAASNLVPGDTNGVSDVFVRDRMLNSTTRVSVGAGGAQASSGSDGGRVSSDGRYVAFRSGASDLVPGDTNGASDVFVRDTVAGNTSRVSVDSSGAQGNGGSSSGESPSISGDGRYVAFTSSASNLVGDDTNGADDVFVRDRVQNRTVRISTSSQFGQLNGESSQPALQGDGRYVVFSTTATNGVIPDANGAAADIILRANPAPTITSVTPTSVARGATATITLTGSYFLPGLTPVPGDGITVTSTNVISESQAALTFSVAPSAATGPRAVVVFLPGAGPGVLSGAAAQFTLNVT